MRFVAMLAFAVCPMVGLADEKKAIGPDEAIKKIDEDVVVEMEVKSARVTDAKVCYLNSKSDYKNKDNLTIFLPKTAADQLKSDLKTDDLAKYLKGKKIKVTGKVTKYRDRPQIKVEDVKKLTVAEKSS